MNPIIHREDCENCESSIFRRSDDLIRWSNPPKIEVECVYCGHITFRPFLDEEVKDED